MMSFVLSAWVLLVRLDVAKVMAEYLRCFVVGQISVGCVFALAASLVS
jgi:hypothetical protein